jgi:hypothetical protein
MESAVVVRRLILAGSGALVAGITLYFLLDQIVDLRVSLYVLDGAAALSLGMVVLGLLGILIGSLIWASKAPINWLLWPGLIVGAVALWITEYVDINIHGPSAILMFPTFAGLVAGPVLLLIAGIRYARSRFRVRRDEQNPRS